MNAYLCKSMLTTGIIKKLPLHEHTRLPLKISLDVASAPAGAPAGKLCATLTNQNEFSHQIPFCKLYYTGHWLSNAGRLIIGDFLIKIRS
jgi:hypothetical protein